MADKYYRNGGGNARPTSASETGRIDAEFRKLWMKLRSQQENDTIPKEVVWSWSGPVIPWEDTDGQRWPTPANLRIVGCFLTLQTPATSSYTVEVYTDFGFLQVMELDAGTTVQRFGVNKFFPSGTSVWPRVKENQSGDGEQMAIIFRYLWSDS